MYQVYYFNYLCIYFKHSIQISNMIINFRYFHMKSFIQDHCYTIYFCVRYVHKFILEYTYIYLLIILRSRQKMLQVKLCSCIQSNIDKDILQLWSKKCMSPRVFFPLKKEGIYFENSCKSVIIL